MLFRQFYKELQINALSKAGKNIPKKLYKIFAQ
jgi:hypothetical protein